MSENMVERLARAMCKSRTGEGSACCQWPGSGGRLVCFAAQGNFDDGALAALEAMREPTFDMWTAGNNVEPLHSDSRDIWRTMIDSAIRSGEKG